MSSREALLAAALRLIEIEGEAGFSTRGACALAGVTAPTLYHHFGTADGLLSAAVEAAFGQFLARKRAMTGGDPLEALRRGWDDYVAFAVERPRLYAAMIARVLKGADVPAATQARALLVSKISALTAERGLAGSAEAAADLVWGSAHGAAMAAVISGRAPPPAHLAALRDAALNLVLNETEKRACGCC